jgi:hypothetical protein
VDFKRALQCSSPTIAKTYFILQHKPLFYIAAKTFYFILQQKLLFYFATVAPPVPPTGRN